MALSQGIVAWQDKGMTMLAATLAILAAQAAAAPPPRTPAQIVAEAPVAAWRRFADDELLVMDLADGTRVAIALAPAFAPVHVGNIRTLAQAGWWDGTSVNRVQDNYVVQWGDATERKPLPPGIVAAPPAEYERPRAGLGMRAMRYRDAYAARVGHAGGWPVAAERGTAWATHCYGMVGVGRNAAPDTGTGAELYAVIGHGPRHLDRNIALVGRVVDGMEGLAARPRGSEALGFYKEAGERTDIVRVRLATDLPAGERPAYEWLDDASPSFAAWLTARANRKDDFFIRPAGAIDICNALPPVRRVAAR